MEILFRLIKDVSPICTYLVEEFMGAERWDFRPSPPLLPFGDGLSTASGKETLVLVTLLLFLVMAPERLTTRP